MITLIKIDGEYANWIKDLSLRFRQSQIKAAIRVNSEMLRFYFSLGADIVNKKAESRWGDGFFKNLSRDLQNELPGVRGFSVTNLKHTKLFYQLYNQLFTISTQDEDQLNIFQISWSHHKYIIDKYHVLKRDGDNPTVGLLICKDKDDVMAHYALEGYNTPLGISEYELSKLFPKDFKSTLPSIEDIENELK